MAAIVSEACSVRQQRGALVLPQFQTICRIEIRDALKSAAR
jgi:hypothetical protein